MEIDNPTALAELEAAFAAYERALTSNDVPTLDRLFWASSKVIRYGATENLYGSAEIEAFRAARPSTGLERTLERTVITTFGRDHGTASTLFRRASMPGKIGRQMQTWVRFPEGWKVVAASVSFVAE